MVNLYFRSIPQMNRQLRISLSSAHHHHLLPCHHRHYNQLPTQAMNARHSHWLVTTVTTAALMMMMPVIAPVHHHCRSSVLDGFVIVLNPRHSHMTQLAMAANAIAHPPTLVPPALCCVPP